MNITTVKVDKILNPFYEIMPLKGLNLYELITDYLDFPEVIPDECKTDLNKIETLRNYHNGIDYNKNYKLIINGEAYDINYEINPILYKFLYYRIRGTKDWLKYNKNCITDNFTYQGEIEMLLFSNCYWSGLTSNQTPDKKQNYAQIDKDIYNPLIYIPKICNALINIDKLVNIEKLVNMLNLPGHIHKLVSNFMIYKTKLFRFAKRYWECLISIMINFNCNGNPYGEEYGGGCPIYIDGILSTYGINYSAFYMYNYCNIYISEAVKTRITTISKNPDIKDTINKDFILDEPLNIKYIEGQYKYTNISKRSDEDILINFRQDENVGDNYDIYD
jgi:hypothetical protein